MGRMTFTSTRLIWVKAHCGPYRDVSANILREVNQYFPRDQLLPACYQALVIYNSATWQHWVLPTALSSGTLFCIVDSVLAVAFHEVSVTLIDMLDCSITPLLPLNTARRSQSLLAYRGAVYVFGGTCENAFTATCLRLGLRSKVWTSLPDMQSEYCLTWPALWQEEAYLVPKLSGDYIEVFAMASQSFRLIPRPLDLGWKGIFAVCKEDQLLILRSDGLLESWNLVTKEFTPRCKAASAFVSELTCSPHLARKEVLWLSRGQAVLHRLDLNTCKVTTTKLELNSLAVKCVN